MKGSKIYFTRFKYFIWTSHIPNYLQDFSLKFFWHFSVQTKVHLPRSVSAESACFHFFGSTWAPLDLSFFLSLCDPNFNHRSESISSQPSIFASSRRSGRPNVPLPCFLSSSFPLFGPLRRWWAHTRDPLDLLSLFPSLAQAPGPSEPRQGKPPGALYAMVMEIHKLLHNPQRSLKSFSYFLCLAILPY